MALLACGGAYWPLAFEHSAMTSRHLKGGGGLAGPPLLPGSPYGPRRRRAEHFEAYILLAPKAPNGSLKHWKGRRGGGGSRGGVPPLLLRCTAALIHRWGRSARSSREQERVAAALSTRLPRGAPWGWMVTAMEYWRVQPAAWPAIEMVSTTPSNERRTFRPPALSVYRMGCTWGEYQPSTSPGWTPNGTDWGTTLSPTATWSSPDDPTFRYWYAVPVGRQISSSSAATQKVSNSQRTTSPARGIVYSETKCIPVPVSRAVRPFGGLPMVTNAPGRRHGRRAARGWTLGARQMVTRGCGVRRGGGTHTFGSQTQGCIGRGRAPPPSLQGAQPIPSHCPPDSKGQLERHL